MNNRLDGVYWPRNIDIREKQRGNTNSPNWKNIAKTRRTNMHDKQPKLQRANNLSHRRHRVLDTEKNRHLGRYERESRQPWKVGWGPNRSDGRRPKQEMERHRDKWHPREQQNDCWKRAPRDDSHREWASPLHNQGKNRSRQNTEKNVHWANVREFKGAIVDALKNMTRSIEIIENKCLDM